MTIAPFTLKSATTQVAAPFVLGHAFKKGDVPAGAQLVASIADFQVTPKNVWPDGSLKFAVLSGRAALTGGVDLSVAMTIGTPAAGTALALSDLKATGVTASLACGAFGTVSWATTEWDAPFETEVSGPKMSRWRYRKPVGADAHLVVWLDVTLWAGGEVEVLPWIENGYTRVAGPTNKSATYVFTLGGTQRESVLIDLKHHQRTPILTGTKLAHWLGTDPGVTPTHDKAYLQASELVPSYSGVLSPTGAEATRLAASYTPLQAGDLAYDSEFMGSTGYQRPIGLLPACDVVYLTSTATNAYAAVVRNGFSAGRFTSHMRNEATNKPILFSAYPNFTLQDGQGFRDNGGSTTGDVAPTIVGGSNHPISWDTAHSPLVGYMTYLLTGRKYFAEETQFAANYDYIGQGDNSALRSGSQGLMRPEVGAWQTRAAAWQWRTRSAALTITPDSDTALRAEYARTIENTINSFHTKYIAQANNPWGIIEPGEMYDNDNFQTVAIWQQDFFTAVMGWTICQELPISSTHKARLAALFQWKAKSAVLRLGTSGNFWYVNPMPYQMAVSPPSATLIDYDTGAGPWLATEAAVYDGTYNPLKPAYQGGHFSTTEGTIQGEYSPAEWVTSMLGNLMPAISYAVRHEVPGAAAGYARLTGATNWPTVATNFNLKPGWSVKPAASASGASILTTPGPSVVMDSVSLLGASMAVLDTHRGLGVPLTEVPTGGADGTAPLRDMIQVGDNPLSEIRWAVTRQPPGNLQLDGLGGFSYSGAAGSFDYEAFLDGASLGTATIELVDPSTITSVIVAPSSGVVASGGTRAHSATVSGTGSPSQSVTWTTTLGSINAATGLLTAPAANGSTQTGTITARSAQDTTKTGTATFTVLAATSTVSGVTVSPSAPSVSGGATQAFAATVAGTFTPSQAVNWTSSAGSISSSGLFTAPAAGSSAQTITITATSVQDGTKSGTATVTVPSAASTVSGVSVLPASASLTGGQAQTFTATVNGTFSPSQAVTWATTLGTIDPATGVLTAPATTLSLQSGTVTATSVQDGTKAGTASFTVAAASAATVTSVTVSPLTVTLAGGATQAFAATVAGTNSPSQAVVWSASAGAISSSGAFTAPAAVHAVQTITITARSSIDNTKTGSATVQVAGDGAPITVAPNRVLRTAAGNRILRG